MVGETAAAKVVVVTVVGKAAAGWAVDLEGVARVAVKAAVVMEAAMVVGATVAARVVEATAAATEVAATAAD